MVVKKKSLLDSKNGSFSTLPYVNYGMTQVELANFAGINPVQETYPTNE